MTSVRHGHPLGYYPLTGTKQSAIFEKIMAENGRGTKERINVKVDSMVRTSKRRYTRLEWEEWYQYAKEYYLTYQNLRIPIKYKTKNGLLLGRWIERQRAAYHEKGSYIISDTQISLLNQIGMEWTMGIRTQWDIWYQYCVRYYSSYGHLNIPKNYIYKHLPLGEWLCYQRKRYKQKKISDSEIAKLEQLGMRWQIRIRREWDDWYQEAKEYYERYGDLKVPLNYVTESGLKLGLWINIQREKYRGTRTNNIDSSKLLKLNQIGMLWGFRSSRS
ncbi:helicase associated domain-containing protein [Robinsoniella peoriensis]|uniref:helicase associated domain-containing protein n=1 Tax=Robinsoniella peoriensis TaxID=180332 RepID=UPI00366E4808